jgi:uncharacterized protein (TIGR02391 family)
VRGKAAALDLWLDPNHPVPPMAYLDAGSWKPFVDWLSQDYDRIQKISDREWQICLFRSQLNRHYGADRVRNRRLAGLGIEFDEANLHQSDEMFIAETLCAYFPNEPAARPQAELLALSRRRAGNDWITVISQHRGYWRIPLVNTYFIDFGNLTGRTDLPAQFDFVLDFEIHRELARAVEQRINISPPGDTMQAAIIALRDHIRRISKLPQQDGRNLMEQAFKQDGSYLKLSPLTGNQSQADEQRGFREFYCAVMTGLRNPLFHEGPDSAFAQARYPNRRTLLKYLSFLSILFERADSPFP